MHHFAKVCKSRTNTVNSVSDDEPDQEADVLAITQLPSKNEIHCTAAVNKRSIKLKVDTGAKCNVLPLDIFRQVKKETINKLASVHLVAYGGDRFSTLGITVLRCQIGRRSELITFQVIDRQATPILGLNDVIHLGLIHLDKAVYEVKTEEKDNFHQQTVKAYADLFDDELGTLPINYRMRIDTSVCPVVKLDIMVKKGVIVEETEPTE
jgi:hypothetical protein